MRKMEVISHKNVSIQPSCGALLMSQKYLHVSISFCSNYWRGHLKSQHFFILGSKQKKTKQLLVFLQSQQDCDVWEGGRGGIVLHQIKSHKVTAQWFSESQLVFILLAKSSFVPLSQHVPYQVQLLAVTVETPVLHCDLDQLFLL